MPDHVLTEQNEGASSTLVALLFSSLVWCETHQPKPGCFASSFGIFREGVAISKCLPEEKETRDLSQDVTCLPLHLPLSEVYPTGIPGGVYKLTN